MFYLFVHLIKLFCSRKARDIIVGVTQLLIPGGRRVLGWLGIPIFKPTETQFFIDSIRQTIRETIQQKLHCFQIASSSNSSYGSTRRTRMVKE